MSPLKIAAAALPLALAPALAAEVDAQKAAIAAALACLEREAGRIEQLTEDLQTVAQTLVTVSCDSEVQADTKARLARMTRPTTAYMNEARQRTVEIFIPQALKFALVAREKRLNSKP